MRVAEKLKVGTGFLGASLFSVVLMNIGGCAVVPAGPPVAVVRPAPVVVVPRAVYYPGGWVGPRGHWHPY